MGTQHLAPGTKLLPAKTKHHSRRPAPLAPSQDPRLLLRILDKPREERVGRAVAVSSNLVGAASAAMLPDLHLTERLVAT